MQVCKEHLLSLASRAMAGLMHASLQGAPTVTGRESHCRNDACKSARSTYCNRSAEPLRDCCAQVCKEHLLSQAGRAMVELLCASLQGAPYVTGRQSQGGADDASCKEQLLSLTSRAKAALKHASLQGAHTVTGRQSHGGTDARKSARSTYFNWRAEPWRDSCVQVCKEHLLSHYMSWVRFQV